MKERVTLVTAVAAIVLVAFARCEPSHVVPTQWQGLDDDERDLPAGELDQFIVTPFVREGPVEPPKPNTPEAVVTVPNEQLLIPLRPDPEKSYHHIIFGDIDNPHADEDMVIKPPGGRTWPMPVLPRVK